MNNNYIRIQKYLDLFKNVIFPDFEDIQKAYLFGSYVYGNPNDNSDIDICLIISNTAKRRLIDISADVNGLFFDKCEEQDIEYFPNDIIPIREKDFEIKSSIPTMFRTIFKQGELIYERTA